MGTTRHDAYFICGDGKGLVTHAVGVMNFQAMKLVGILIDAKKLSKIESVPAPAYAS